MEVLDFGISLLASFVVIDVLQLIIFGIVVEEITYLYTSKGIMPGNFLIMISKYSMGRLKNIINLLLLLSLTIYFWENELFTLPRIFCLIIFVFWFLVRNLIVRKLNIFRYSRELLEEE